MYGAKHGLTTDRISPSADSHGLTDVEILLLGSFARAAHVLVECHGGRQLHERDVVVGGAGVVVGMHDDVREADLHATAGDIGEIVVADAGADVASFTSEEDIRYKLCFLVNWFV